MSVGKKSSLQLRIISGIVLFALFLGALFVAPWGILVLYGLTQYVLAKEWVNVCHISEKRRAQIVLFVVCIGSLALSYFNFIFAALGLLFLLAGAAILMGWLTWRNGFFWLAFGIFYFGLSCVSLAILVNAVEAYVPLLIWVVMIIGFTDIGGYLIGSLVGGAKMAPHISPNKTWSGFCGSIVISGFSAIVFDSIFKLSTSFNAYFLLSLVLSFLAILGDLIESYIKRIHNVKDSGASIPGHGGVMDRLDGYTLCLPFLAFVAYHWPALLEYRPESML